MPSAPGWGSWASMLAEGTGVLEDAAAGEGAVGEDDGGEGDVTDEEIAVGVVDLPAGVVEMKVRQARTTKGIISSHINNGFERFKPNS